MHFDNDWCFKSSHYFFFIYSSFSCCILTLSFRFSVPLYFLRILKIPLGILHLNSWYLSLDDIFSSFTHHFLNVSSKFLQVLIGLLYFPLVLQISWYFASQQFIFKSSRYVIFISSSFSHCAFIIPSGFHCFIIILTDISDFSMLCISRVCI